MISKFKLISFTVILLSFTTSAFSTDAKIEQCKPTQEQILESIDEMSEVELSNLIQALEAKFGVSVEDAASEYNILQTEK